MDSFLRDIDREQGKLHKDVANFNRHYDQLRGYVHDYIKQTTVEWAKLVASHPKALLCIIETTPILDENGYSYSYSGHEPIRFTTLSLADGEIWDQLVYPTQSKMVKGFEYHGLTMADLEGKPRLADVWSSIAEVLEGRHLIIFGVEWAKKALQSVYHTYILDEAFDLHNKCKEYYDQFYELSLQTVLGYQGIDKKREELVGSRERIVMIAQVLQNIAEGKAKQEPEPEPEPEEDAFFAEELTDHPF